MTAPSDLFKLVRPCANCPFRTDAPPFLRRAPEIAQSIAEGSFFSCHKTVDYEVDEEERFSPLPGEQFCAGALILMEKAGARNQAVRLAERLDMHDPARLDLEAPVFDSLAAFVRHHRGDEPEPEVCHVAEQGCEAPAGYMVGGHAIPAEPEGEVHECPTCGEWVCDSCSNDEGVCGFCQS